MNYGIRFWISFEVSQSIEKFSIGSLLVNNSNVSNSLLSRLRIIKFLHMIPAGASVSLVTSNKTNHRFGRWFYITIPLKIFTKLKIIINHFNRQNKFCECLYKVLIIKWLIFVFSKIIIKTYIFVIEKTTQIWRTQKSLQAKRGTLKTLPTFRILSILQRIWRQIQSSPQYKQISSIFVYKTKVEF